MKISTALMVYIFELHHGGQLSFEVIAIKLNLDFSYLLDAVDAAKTFGFGAPVFIEGVQ